VVRATGGLADTVIDAADEKHGNGFVFGPATTAAALLDGTCNAPPRPAASPRSGASLQKHGMARDSSWREAAGHYVELYESLLRTPP
jgi:starch synthase